VRDVDLGRPDASGAFRGTIPRIRSITIRACAPGWRSASARVALDGRTEVADVALTLHRAPFVRGTLLGADGRPLAQRPQLGCYAVRRGRFADFTQDGMFATHPDGGWTLSRSMKDDLSVAISVSSCTVGPDGAFEVAAKCEGDVWLVAHVAGFRPIWTQIGHVNEDRVGVALVATPAPEDAPRVHLTIDGRPLAEQSVSAADLSFPDIQPGFVLEADADGRVPTIWFERGRRYYLGPSVYVENGRGIVEWHGQDAIELTTLPKTP
jgi:hypothetical protein